MVSKLNECNFIGRTSLKISDARITGIRVSGGDIMAQCQCSDQIPDYEILVSALPSFVVVALLKRVLWILRFLVCFAPNGEVSCGAFEFLAVVI